MVLRLIEINKENYEDKKVLRDVIDYQFIATKKFQEYYLAIYLIFYFIPLYVQIRCNKPHIVILLNGSCLIVQTFCFFYEIIQIKFQGFASYFGNYTNYFDCGIFIIYSFYFLLRMNCSNYKLIPEMPSESLMPMDETNHFKEQRNNYFMYYTPLLNVSLILLSFFKLILLLRVYQNYGQFFQLLMSCMSDVRIFLIFFYSWVVLFSMLFKITGSTVDQSDYEGA